MGVCSIRVFVCSGYLPDRHVTMAKLLEQLTKKAQNEVIEALRVLVTSCNGIAAVHQIKHEVHYAALYVIVDVLTY